MSDSNPGANGPPDVIDVSYQHSSMTLPAWLLQQFHVPDYFIRRRDGSAVVLDVRPDTLVTTVDRDVFQAAKDLSGRALRTNGTWANIDLAHE